ncbi:MAG: TolC family protein [Phycisphaerae bacterium]|nr:TolC family protein [Phycisphaerae bacterium]
MVLHSSRTTLQITIQFIIATFLASCASSIDATKDVKSATMLATTRLPVLIDESLVWNPSEPLSVDAAISYAIMHDALLQRDMAIIVQRRAEIAQAELPANPTFSGAFGVAIDGLSGAPIIMQGMQGLSWLWTRPDRIAASEQTLQQAILTAANRTVIIVAEVRTAHAEVSKDMLHVQAVESSVSLSNKALEITSELVSAGEASLDEIDEVTLALEKNKHLLLSKIKTLKLSKLKLLEVMGCPDYIELVSIIPNDFSAQPADFDERTLLELAIKNRLDLATKRAVVQQMSAELGLANPPLLSGTIGFNENFVDRQAIMGGGSVTIALDGDAKEAIADSKLKQAELNYIDALRTVQYEVRSTLEQYLTVQEQSEVIDPAIIATTNMRLRRANEMFHRGELHPLSLINFQQEVLDANILAIEDKLTLATTRFNLELAVGGTFRDITQ